MTFDLVQYPTTETIKIITLLLERITKTNDRIQYEAQRQKSLYACFYARAIPNIDIQSYLARILKYCPCSNECFLSILVYFDRMSRNSTGLRIDSYNIHRLIITGLMVASKFFSDVYYTNARYAKVGGLPVAELNLLEIEFLKLNDFSMNVQVEELQQYGDQLLSHWIRENNKLKHQQEQSYHYDYKNVEYKPTVKYSNITQKQKSLVKMRSCSSDLLYNEKSVSDQYEPTTRSC